MEILQWTMTIPKEKQWGFTTFHKDILGPIWKKFGAENFELLRVFADKVGNRQEVSENEFIERLYLKEGITAKDFFQRVKQDADAWELSRTYEGKFGIEDVELKILKEK